MNPLTLVVSLHLILAVSSMALFSPQAAETPEISYGDLKDPSEPGVLLFIKLFNPSNPAAKSRPSRSSNQKTCGQKILEYTMRVCQSLDIKTNTEVDISTKCCSARCSDQFIREAMCPEKAL